MLIRYIGPIGGGVEIAATGDHVKPNDTVTVADELGLSLCDQPGNWEPGDDTAWELFDRFCAWVAAHERRPVNIEQTEWAWVPRQSEPDGTDAAAVSDATGEPAHPPAAGRREKREKPAGAAEKGGAS
jgi:hypothetical protein